MIDSTTFRQVLGNYPTGVCAVSALDDDGTHAAMIVGTFTSVSLDPPLVGFFPDRKSQTWPRIEATGRFCVNVLGADQKDLCLQLASPGMAKTANIDFGLSPGGSPIVAGVIAWIDCAIEQAIAAGDHYLVLGRVEAMEVVRQGEPLLFFRGRYGSFAELEGLTE